MILEEISDFCDVFQGRILKGNNLGAFGSSLNLKIMLLTPVHLDPLLGHGGRNVENAK